MAKTVFANGSILTPAFCNAQFGTSAITGHVHDGIDTDGHQPLVDINAHTTGQLLYNRIEAVEGSFVVSYPDQFELPLRTYTCYYKKTTFGTAGMPAKVEIFFPYLRWGAGAVPNTFIADGTPIPLAIRPNGVYPNYQAVERPITVFCGSMTQLGSVAIEPTGELKFYICEKRNNYYNGGGSAVYVDYTGKFVLDHWSPGDKGHPPFCITYPKWP